MPKALNQLARAVESWALTLDALHDSDGWMAISEDLRTQVLIDLKEMRNALGHAKDEASRAGVSEGGGNGNRSNHNLRTEAEELEREIRTRILREQISPEAIKAARAARRKPVKRRRRRR